VSVLVSVLIWIADRVRGLFMRRRSEHQTERHLVSGLLTFLDGRRVLFDPMTLEDPERVAASLLQIRERVDGDLARLQPGAKAGASLRAIRAACLQYLTRVPRPDDAPTHWPDAINELRDGVRKGIEALELDYKLTMPGGTGRPIRTIYIPGPRRED
jgi:hypothetical protein